MRRRSRPAAASGSSRARKPSPGPARPTRMRRILPIAALLLVAATPATERQRAEHALDRLAFGARPGDVERVVKTGVDRWIDEQLHPERIADRAVAARVAQYEKPVPMPSR